MVSWRSLPAVLLVCSGLLLSQQAVPERDWALETPNGGPGEEPSVYSPVSQRGEASSTYFVLRWQSGWDRNDKNLPQAIALTAWKVAAYAWNRSSS